MTRPSACAPILEYLAEGETETLAALDGRPGVVCLAAPRREGDAAWVGFSAETSDGEAAERFRLRAAPYLALVTPAYRSAVAAVDRLATHAHALGRIMDHLDEPLMIVDACGRPQHVNRALDRILAAYRGGEDVFEAMRQEAVRLLDLPGALERGEPGRPLVGPYRVDAVFADPALANGAPMVLVRLERSRHHTHLAEDLRRRFGLSPRQAEVAGLLLQGATAKRVAAALGIRVNTARNHIQTVLRRMGVSSKAELPARILSPESQ